MKKRILAITILFTMMLTMCETSLTVLAEEIEEAIPAISAFSQTVMESLSTEGEDEAADGNDVTVIEEAKANATEYNASVENEIQLMSTGTYYSELGIYFDASTGTITDADTSITSIDIPDEIDEVAVTSIGDDAFRSCYSLTSVTIPDSVVSIGASAFEYCYSLTSVTIPDSVASIGASAFEYCDRLTSISIPNSVTGIGNYTFYNCSSLKSLNIPDSVTSIGDYTFAWCYSLTSITIPDSVTSIGNYAFVGCGNLISVTIGASVASIGNDVFIWCESLTDIIVDENNIYYCSIDGNLFNKDKTILIQYLAGKENSSYVIPDSVMSIGEYAFGHCTGLTSVTIPDSVTSIENGAFEYCISLTSITIPDSVTSIGENAFEGCENLISVTIGNGVTSIGESAFGYCGSLTSVTIGESVTSIGEDAFDYCRGLERINWDAKNVADFSYNDGVFAYAGQESDGIEVVFGDDVERIPAYAFCPYSSSRYSPNITRVTIGNNVISIGENAFAYCENLTSITIPDSVMSIGEYAFGHCTGLTSVTIPDSVTSIENGAFEYCISLTSITIPDSVTSIGEIAFAWCYSLTSVTIPDSVASIGRSAFSDCNSLSNVTIGKNVTSIGDYAFENCMGLKRINWNAKNVADFSYNDYVFAYAGQDGEGIKVVFGDDVEHIPAYAFCPYSDWWTDCEPNIISITIGDSVTSIGRSAFEYCNSLTSITIGKNVTSIGNYAFGSCYSLASVTIPDSVTSIGNHAFYGCGSLTSVTIPDSVTSIGESAFGYCGSLTSVTIGSGVTSIENGAFEYCNSLTSITIGKNVTSIGENAFAWCYSLTSVTIPDSVTSIGEDAFLGCNSLSNVTIGKNVTSIGDYAFENCMGLKRINWNAKNVADFSYNNYVFYAAGRESEGVEVVFGDNVEHIPAYAFESEPNITSVTIGNNVTSIGKFAFWSNFWDDDKNVITKVNIKSLEQWCTIDFANSLSNPLCTDGSLYLNDEIITNLKIPDSITSIGDYAFCNYSSLKSLNIPNGVTSIGDDAFYDCSSLTSVAIPDSVMSIGEYAFGSCESLTNITIGNNVIDIGERAFYNCAKLERINWNAKNVDDFSSYDYVFSGAGQESEAVEVVFGDNVERIPAYALSAGTNITSITIPDSVTSIGENAFEGCTGLEKIYWNAKMDGDLPGFQGFGFANAGQNGEGIEVIFGDNVERIPGRVFYDCSSLINITIGNNVIDIGERAFYNCAKLERINWNAKNVDDFSSYDYVFSGAGQESEAVEVVFGDNVKSIPSSVFMNCESLTSITIPDSVTYIGYNAFRGCTGLTSIIIPNSVTNIKSYVFSGCDSLASITIPDSVTSIWESAFENCSSLNEVYYGGTKDEWKKISIGSYNTSLTSANIHYLYNTSGGGIVNETRYGDINFKVTGFEDTDDLSIKSEPVANATITVNDVTKTTDANGIVGFSKDEITLDSNLVQVSASAEGYLDYKNEIILVAYGTNNISMTKKNPDKIYIANLSATGANGKLYNVMQQNTFTVDKTDTTKYTFKVNMDWNGFAAGKVYLQGTKSGKSFEFVNGEVTVSPGVEFDVGENIRVIAYTADESKSTSKENLLNVIALPEDFSLVIPEVQSDGLSAVSLLEGKSLQLGFNTGIEKFAGKVEVKDGKLVIAFEGGETGKANVKKGVFKVLDGKGLSIGPYGKIEIPLTDMQNAEWSGNFGAKAGVSEFLKYNHTHWIFTPTGVSIPVNVKVALSGDLESLFNVSGTLQNPKFSGEITPALELDAFGGVGFDYDSVVAKVGVYGTLNGELAIILLTEKATPEFEPAVEGEIGVRGEVKVWIWEAKGEEQAGKFRWDKNGFKASWLGFDVLMLSIENDDNAGWRLAGREYLENGGGFTGGGFADGNKIALFDLEVTNKDEQIIYNNIFHNAEAVLQNINDKKYLIYTVDDIEREEQNGLKLVFSEKLSDGSWSEPTPIDDDGTLDSIISADEKFVAWEDMKSEISSSATSLPEIFAQTEISAAYFDGEKWNSTQLTDDDVYDFSPVIKSNGDMAVVAWLSNTESDFTSKSGITNIHYATFDGTNWSEATTIEDVGAVMRVTAAYDGDTPYVFYKKDGIISSVAVSNGTVTALSYSGVGQYAVDNFNGNVVLAYFDADGNLKVASDAINSSAASTITTETNVNSIPVIATNDTNMYVGWLDRQDGYDTLCGARYENGAWSDKITFVGEEANVSNPSLVANDDGTFSASYFKTGKIEVSESGDYTTGEVNLFVNNISPSYNLAIGGETLSYDDEIYARGGGAAMTFDVMNVGEKTVSGFDVEIYENDELKKTISKTTELKAGATTNVYASYVPNESGKVQKLQIKVIPKGVDDFDENDNVAILTLGTIDATVTSAYFTEEGSLNCVNAIIRNNGSANVDSINVSVHKGSQDGEVIYQTEIEDVLAYEELLIKTEISKNDLLETSLFYVTVEAQSDMNIYNDYSIAVKVNDGDFMYGQGSELSVAYDIDTKTATIKSDTSLRGEVIAAAYQGGRLISVKSKPINISIGDTPAVFDDLVTENADTVKIMVWNDMSTLNPLCDTCVVELK